MLSGDCSSLMSDSTILNCLLGYRMITGLPVGCKLVSLVRISVSALVRFASTINAVLEVSLQDRMFPPSAHWARAPACSLGYGLFTRPGSNMVVDRSANGAMPHQGFTAPYSSIAISHLSPLRREMTFADT